MEGINKAVEEALRGLENIDQSISGIHVSSAQELSVKINNFVHTLSNLHKAGESMESGTLVPVPIDLLNLLDQEDSNSPEVFEAKLLGEVQKKTMNMGSRIYYLQNLKGAVKEAHEGLSSAEHQH